MYLAMVPSMHLCEHGKIRVENWAQWSGNSCKAEVLCLFYTSMLKNPQFHPSDQEPREEAVQDKTGRVLDNKKILLAVNWS